MTPDDIAAIRQPSSDACDVRLVATFDAAGRLLSAVDEADVKAGDSAWRFLYLPSVTTAEAAAAFRSLFDAQQQIIQDVMSSTCRDREELLSERPDNDRRNS